MYPTVTEYFGSTTAYNGKNIYEFDGGTVPPGDIYQVLPPSTSYYADNFAWKRGKMTHKITYDNSNHKLAEDSIFYVNYNASERVVGVGSFQATVLPGVEEGACIPGSCLNEGGAYTLPDEFTFVQYSQSSGAMQEALTSSYRYENGNVAKSVRQKTSKTYETSNLQLTQKTVMRSNLAEQAVTVNRYPFQFTVNASSTGAAGGIYMLNQKNIVSTPLETYTYLQNTDGTNARVVSGQATTFKQNANNSNYVVADQIYVWENPAAIPLISYSPSSINGTNSGVTLDTRLKPRIALANYNDFGGLQVASKTNDVPISYQYGYNRTMPIAEVKNAQNNIYMAPAVLSVSMGGSGTTVSQNFTFTVAYAGTVTLKLGVNGSPSYSTSATFSNFSSGSIGTLATGGCGLSVLTFPNVQPGTYTLDITLTTTNNGVGACGEIDYPSYTPQGTTEFQYESFEESTATGVVTNASVAHCGKSYFNGDYPTTFTLPNSRSYLVEYWYLDGTNTWQYMSKPYTGVTTLTDGSAIDDVRIYPVDAQMKSYTYDPVLGMTSSIDESGRALFYDYDTFGRLMRIRNDQGGVEKQYAYFYKGN
jgi:YD repeat-containing protein